MASDRERRIRAQKRQEFRDRQNRNRIISQLEALYGAGYTADEIREAGNDAFTELGGTFENGRYIVRDGDTVQTIAEKAGVDATDILKANPDMSAPQTGMVINVPSAPMPTAPGTQGWRDRNLYGGPSLGQTFQGGIGLPSNAALGGATTNPQGASPFQAEKQQTRGDIYLAGIEARRRAQQQNILGALTRDTPYPGYGPNAPRGEQRRYPLYANNTVPQQGPYPLYANNTVPQQGPYPLYAAGVMALQQAQAAQQATQQPQPPTPARPAGPARTVINTALPPGFQQYSMMEENYHYNLLRKVNSPTYTPSQADLNYLEHVGLIKKKPPEPAYVGGGGFSSPRRRGGGGRAPQPPRQTGAAPPPQERLPAFSSGSSFNGLVNWRI